MTHCDNSHNYENKTNVEKYRNFPLTLLSTYAYSHMTHHLGIYYILL